MLYSFPDWMYISGVAAECYSDVNYSLSNGDKEAALLMYPTDSVAGVAALKARLRVLKEQLSADISDAEISVSADAAELLTSRDLSIEARQDLNQRLMNDF